jgi:hypothetical protein
MIRRRWYSHDRAVRRDGTPVPRNYAVPRYAYRVQHAHTAHEAIVYATLIRESRELVGHQNQPLGRVCLLSVRNLAAACRFADDTDRPHGMPVGTVRKVLRSLIRKHSVLQWSVSKATPEPRSRGDHGGITAWRLPSYEDVLTARRADPEIGKLNGKMFVIGRGRRFLTQAELDSWAVSDAAVTAAGPRAYPAGPELPDEEQKAAETQQPATPAAEPPKVARGRPAPPPALELTPIRDALASVCELGAGDDDALHVFANARANSAEIPVEGIAQVVLMVAAVRRKHAPSYQFSPGFFSAKALDGPVRDWMERARKQKLATDKQSRWDRDHRINFLIEAMGAIADAATNPNSHWDEQDLAYYRERLADAEPTEHAEAVRIYEKARDFGARIRASGGS